MSAVHRDRAVAERLAATITGLWAERGFAVSVWVVETSLACGRGGPVCEIRSDMVNGLPKFEAALKGAGRSGVAA